MRTSGLAKRGARDPFYGVTARAGLHVLKDKWKQKTFLADQCKELARTLDEAIDATTRASPARTGEQLRIDHGRTRLPVEQMGRSKRHPGLIRPSDERLLEDALHAAFADTAPASLSNLWSRIVTKQYALFDRRAKAGWGHIDLLGVLGDRPVIIELKKGSSTEPPLRPLIEAASYAIALRRNWVAFSEAFATAVGAVSTVRDPIPLVVLAPPSYWELWSERQTWRTPYQAVVDGLAARGYPARFASVAGEPRKGLYARESVHVEELAFP